jgi:Ca2+-binding RTX toxin-like protein
LPQLQRRARRDSERGARRARASPLSLRTKTRLSAVRAPAAFGHGLGHPRQATADSHDWLFGLNGDDSLFGRTGDDNINAGAGNDWLRGDEGNDYLNGRDGNDSLGGGPGNDTLVGRPGNDTLVGRPGNDRVGVIGATGQDHLEGNEGDDTIVANGDPATPAESDTGECGPGNDVAYITASSDRFVGGSAAAAGCEQSSSDHAR